jgi:hypothetical protein
VRRRRRLLERGTAPAGSLGFQHLVFDHPVTNDQSNGFRSRNAVVLGNELVDAREHVRLKPDHDRRALSSWGRPAPFL